MEQKIDITDFRNYLEEIIVRDEEILKPYWEEVERKEENHQNIYIPMNPEQGLAVKELEAAWYLQSELKENDIEQIREKCVKQLDSSDDCDRQIINKRIAVIEGYSEYISKNIDNSNKIK